MNLFKINYLNKIAVLFREAFKFKKYKAMNAVLAVFSGILVIPFVILSFFVAGYLFLLAFPFEILSSLVKSLHIILNDEGKNVKHATQFIIYWISWPVVFSLYITICTLLTMIIPTYALLSFLVYIWSFGGIKPHLFACEEDDISVEITGRYKALPIIFVVLGYTLNFLLPVIHGIIYYFRLYFEYNEEIFKSMFAQLIYPRYFNLSLLFVFIFALIMSFYPRRKNEENK